MIGIAKWIIIEDILVTNLAMTLKGSRAVNDRRRQWLFCNCAIQESVKSRAVSWTHWLLWVSGCTTKKYNDWKVKGIIKCHSEYCYNVFKWSLLVPWSGSRKSQSKGIEENECVLSGTSHMQPLALSMLVHWVQFMEEKAWRSPMKKKGLPSMDNPQVSNSIPFACGWGIGRWFNVLKRNALEPVIEQQTVAVLQKWLWTDINITPMPSIQSSNYSVADCKRRQPVGYPAWDICYPHLMEEQENMLQTSVWIESLEEYSNDPEPDDMSLDPWEPQTSECSNWLLNFDNLRSTPDTVHAAHGQLGDYEMQPCPQFRTSDNDWTKIRVDEPRSGMPSEDQTRPEVPDDKATGSHSQCEYEARWCWYWEFVLQHHELWKPPCTWQWENKQECHDYQVEHKTKQACEEKQPQTTASSTPEWKDLLEGIEIKIVDTTSKVTTICITKSLMEP